MKILFLTDYFPPEYNAAANRVFERACYWAKWGHEVSVLTSAPNFPDGKFLAGYKNKWYQTEVIENIRVIRVKTFIVANKGFFLRILDHLSYMFTSFFTGLFLKKPDVIIATSPQFFTAISGYGLSAIKRVPFIFEIGDLWPAAIPAVGIMKKGFLFNLLEKIELFLYHRATAIVTLTEAFKHSLINRNIPPHKIITIINGVDLQRHQKTARDKSLMQQHHLEDCFTIGYLGNHGLAQSLEKVIYAAQLLQDTKTIKFLLVGDGAERNKLIALTQKLKLTNIQLVPVQSKSEINRYWSLCDVALIPLKDHPAFSEVIPSKLFEAMSMGLPILISAPKGEATKIVENEQAGICVAAENPDEIAAAIRYLHANNAAYHQFTHNSYTAAKHYTRELQAQKMLTVIENVVTAKTKLATDMS